ncbi:flagellar basal-body rod protein FlgB [Malonomonas rubra DSM 5091]|uniref:Flagellar basal body rod protein FlgB n=1 Tax=Malonomonas rubra DSM 5091 TaxID=1122189 RepID=A0A1M6MDG8_MALRU|nr:flagellar basal body rod protein FlgB [Malonomonas rubra]SHJ81470.1 flagellar basal-body rod protein FlgB [Malonomonas rubra DSM 5091]
MADFLIADRSMMVLKKSLDLRSQNQQVIAGNIANAETPGYEARKFDFEKGLRQAMQSPQLQGKTSNPKHLPIGGSSIASVQGEISKVRDTNPLGDGNTVSLDDEMFDLAENQLLFEAGAQMLKKKMGMLKYVAGDGR